MGKQILKILTGLTAVCLLAGCAQEDAAEKAFMLPSETWERQGVVSMTEIGGDIVVLTEDGLICYNGTDENTLEIELESAEHIAADDELLYICDEGAGKILVVDYKSKKIIQTLDFDSQLYNIYDIAVTDQYVIMHGITEDNSAYLMNVDKTTGSTALREVSIGVSCIAPYRENQIWVHYSTDSTTESRFRIYDADENGFEGTYSSGTMDVYDCAYSEDRDALIYSGDDGKVNLISMEDRTIRTISFEGGASSGMIADKNMLAWAMEDGVHFYDLNELENAVTIATYANPSMTVRALIEKYAHETGVVVQEVVIEEKETIDLLLLSEDTRYDLFLMPSYMYFANYVRNQEYGDLAEFDGMAELAQSSGVAPICMQNGEMFGVPVEIAVVDNRNYRADSTMAMLLNLNQYMEANIDLTVPAYYDEDGSGLAEVLEYIRDYDTAAAEYPVLYQGDNTMVECSYLMLNRSSKRTDEAVKFLRYVMEYYADKTNAEDTQQSVTWYEDLAITDESTPKWKFETTDLRLLFLNAARNVLEGASVEEEAQTAWYKARFMILE